MTDELLIQQRAEGLKLLWKNAHVRDFSREAHAKEIGVFLRAHHDKEAEELADLCRDNEDYYDVKNYLTRFTSSVGMRLSQAAKRMNDPDWEIRFQKVLDDNGALLPVDGKRGSYKRKCSISNESIHAEYIKYIRCAAEFVRTDFSEEVQYARKAQLELLEKLEENGNLVNYQGQFAEYLQCKLGR